jgi:hypothetical protein
MGCLFDSRLLSQLDRHYESSCTIQSVIFTSDNANQDVISSTPDVAGMTLIPCRIGPLIEIRPTDDELRSSDIRARRVERQCKLLGYYPGIIPREMQAVVDGVTYPIRGVEHDGSRMTTRLRLEILTP